MIDPVLLRVLALWCMCAAGCVWVWWDLGDEDANK